MMNSNKFAGLYFYPLFRCSISLWRPLRIDFLTIYGSVASDFIVISNSFFQGLRVLVSLGLRGSHQLISAVLFD